MLDPTQSRENERGIKLYNFIGFVGLALGQRSQKALQLKKAGAVCKTKAMVSS